MTRVLPQRDNPDGPRRPVRSLRPELELLAGYPRPGTAAAVEAEQEQATVRRLWAAAREAGGHPRAESMRAGYEQLGRRLYPEAPVEVSRVDAGGVPALLVGADRWSGRMVVLHAGGQAIGSASAYLGLAQLLARACRARVLVPEHRRAPQHPFPAALEDAVAVYRWVLAEGTRAGQVAFVGDCLGGGLVLSTLVALREALPMPAAAVCLSPLTDATLGGRSLVTHAGRDPAWSADLLGWLTHHHLGGLEPGDPRASPVLADLHGLPPLFVLVGSEEVLLEDSLRLHDRAREHDVEVALHVGIGQTHLWPLFAPVSGIARLAIDAIGDFVTTRCR